MNLSVLAQRAREAGLGFLLIGGHAVIAHGHPRNTFDLDLVVPRTAVEAWRALALALGYIPHGEGPTFIQFNPPDTVTLPLDLMIVSEDTYRRLEAAAVDVPVSAAGVRAVGLQHLLALKAHAIRHGHPGRVEKDVDDVIGLVRANHLDVAEPLWRGLFLKYGPPELHEKLLRLQRPDPA
jgi:predicted nucleotidyltransferase